MIEFFKAAFSALGTAATGPVALVAYIAVLLAGTIVLLKERRNKQLLDRIKDIPAKDRRPLVESEMGSVPVPKDLSPEQWLLARIEHNRQIRFWIFAGLILLITVVSAWTFLENQKLRAANPPATVEAVKTDSQNASGNDGSKKADGKEEKTKTSGKIEQQTSGDKSPAIVSNGDVNITFDK